jgi:hypothetical protein
LNVHIVTLPTSQTQAGQFATLPTSENVLGLVGSLDLKISSLDGLMATFPNSGAVYDMISSLDYRVASLDVRVQSVDGRVATLPNSAGLFALVGSLDTRVSSLNTRVGPVDARIAGLNDLGLSDITSGMFGYELETGLTFAQAQRVQKAMLTGVASGGGTNTLVFRDTANTKNRVSMTVDSAGNRSAVTLDGD